MRCRARQDAHPLAQLKLVHDEVDRARAATSARIASFHTRGAVLVSASGVFTALHAANATNWVSVVGTVLFLVAAGFGLAVLAPRSGKETNPSRSIRERLSVDIYSAEYSIVMDNAEVLNADLTLAKTISRRMTIGYVLLVVAWVVSYSAAFVPMK